MLRTAFGDKHRHRLVSNDCERMIVLQGSETLQFCTWATMFQENVTDAAKNKNFSTASSVFPQSTAPKFGFIKFYKMDEE